MIKYVVYLYMNNILNVNYNSCSSELCRIGREFDTDKSSQRMHVSDTRHCHPYTLFYESLFHGHKDASLNIAEMGILDGASLLMLRKYFTQARIVGFEYDRALLRKFIKRFDTSRITLAFTDVTQKDIISQSLCAINLQYDIIIEDTTHQFEDQIRVIENSHKFLKPGGVLIVEDIFRAYKECDYLNRLAPIMNEFQSHYFVDLDHVNRKSTGWNNDKLFVLIKAGAEPIFKNQNKLTIITPSCRPENLIRIRKSINFDYVAEWIIVYDGATVEQNPLLFVGDNECGKIKEFVYVGEGISGNPQRNYALSQISDPDNALLYYLDDDNSVHPDLYKLFTANILTKGRLYSFNQKDRLRGDNINPGHVDTAMCIIDYSLCKNVRWKPQLYDADGHYLRDCYNAIGRHNHVFIDHDMCYYNVINE
jgi:hypothetical protein